jgi:hypothetical protein
MKTIKLQAAQIVNAMMFHRTMAHGSRRVRLDDDEGLTNERKAHDDCNKCQWFQAKLNSFMGFKI